MAARRTLAKYISADDHRYKYPDQHETAKRNLTERIAKFTAQTGYERDQVFKAVDALQDGRFEAGHEAMHRAERSDIYDKTVTRKQD